MHVSTIFLHIKLQRSITDPGISQSILKEKLDLSLNVTFHLSSISEKKPNQAKSKHQRNKSLAEIIMLSGLEYSQCVCKVNLVLTLFPDLCKTDSRSKTCFPLKLEGERPSFAVVVLSEMGFTGCVHCQWFQIRANSNWRSSFLTQVRNVSQPRKKETKSAVTGIYFALYSIPFKPLSHKTIMAGFQVTHWNSLLLFLSLVQNKKEKVVNTVVKTSVCFCWMDLNANDKKEVIWCQI